VHYFISSAVMNPDTGFRVLGFPDTKMKNICSYSFTIL